MTLGGHDEPPAADAGVRGPDVEPGQGARHPGGGPGLHRQLLGPAAQVWSSPDQSSLALDPYLLCRYDVNRRLFEAEEQDLFADLQSLPRQSIKDIKTKIL